MVRKMRDCTLVATLPARVSVSLSFDLGVLKMCRRIDHWLACTVAVVGVCGTGALAFGQDNPLPAVPAAQPAAAAQPGGPAPRQPAGDPLSMDEIRMRFEQQEKQIAELQEQLKKSQQTSQTAPADKLTQADAGKKPEDEAKKAEDGYMIGSDLSAKASFHDGLFLWLNSPHNDFTMHLGAWIQFDNVWWDQSPSLRAPPTTRPGHPQGVATGVAMGGIGELEDGEYFRRIRPFAEGTFWGTGEYRLIPAFENNQFSAAGLDEFWVGETSIPVVGTIRLGHVKDTAGLEGDMTASSRCMTFMERSSYSEAIELNQNFVTGVWLGNNYFDQRMTWSATAFRPDLSSSSGIFFGDGQSGVQGRLTALPLYELEGRHLLHVGLSGGWRDGTANLANAAYPGNTIELRARPEMRDDDPAGSPSGARPSPTPTVTAWSIPA